MQTYNKLQFFVEDQIYWAPADTASDLYQQLASKKYREIPRDQIKWVNIARTIICASSLFKMCL